MLSSNVPSHTPPHTEQNKTLTVSKTNTPFVDERLVVDHAVYYEKYTCLLLLLVYYYDKTPWPMQFIKERVYGVLQFQRVRVYGNHDWEHGNRQTGMALEQ